jgi:hypothetical protein
MQKIPTIRLHNVKPEEYVEAVCILKRMLIHGKLPETIGVYKGTVVSNTHDSWFVWKTKTGYSIQKAYNK